MHDLSSKLFGNSNQCALSRTDVSDLHFFTNVRPIPARVCLSAWRVFHLLLSLTLKGSQRLAIGHIGCEETFLHVGNGNREILNGFIFENHLDDEVIHVSLLWIEILLTMFFWLPLDTYANVK